MRHVGRAKASEGQPRQATNNGIGVKALKYGNLLLFSAAIPGVLLAVRLLVNNGGGISNQYIWPDIMSYILTILLNLLYANWRECGVLPLVTVEDISV